MEEDDLLDANSLAKQHQGYTVDLKWILVGSIIFTFLIYYLFIGESSNFNSILHIEFLVSFIQGGFIIATFFVIRRISEYVEYVIKLKKNFSYWLMRSFAELIAILFIIPSFAIMIFFFRLPIAFLCGTPPNFFSSTSNFDSFSPDLEYILFSIIIVAAVFFIVYKESMNGKVGGLTDFIRIKKW